MSATGRRCEADPDSMKYNEAILNALGEYCSSLPNFQIIEVMIFVLGKVPPRLNYETMDSKSIDVESELQHTMLKAGANYIIFNLYFHF